MMIGSYSTKKRCCHYLIGCCLVQIRRRNYVEIIWREEKMGGKLILKFKLWECTKTERTVRL
jgi:hypothetical protein